MNENDEVKATTNRSRGCRETREKGRVRQVGGGGGGRPQILWSGEEEKSFVV